MVKSLVYHDSDDNSLRALDASRAKGVALPAFTTGTALPAVGTVIGEGFHNTATNTAYIWDGSVWSPITPMQILTYPTDAAVLADTTHTAGSYGASQATGNLFVCYQPPTPPGGIKPAVQWRQVGLRVYATQAAMAAQTNVPDGAIGYCQDVALPYFYGNNQWRPMGVWLDLEANILVPANAPFVNGQIAVSTDTGKVFVGLKTATATKWVAQPFESHATEAGLLASNANVGVLAVAIDTGAVFYRNTTTTWKGLAGMQITNAATAPSTPKVGDFWLHPTSHVLQIYNGTAWQNMGGCKVAATAPINAQTGDQWLDTTNHFLKTWDGAHWIAAPITDMTAGGTLRIPSYFTSDLAADLIPTITNTPRADEVGLAAVYYGGEMQLFTRHGTTFTAVSPWVGKAANAGLVCIADARGNPSWGRKSQYFQIKNNAGAHVAISSRPTSRVRLLSSMKPTQATDICVYGANMRFSTAVEVNIMAIWGSGSQTGASSTVNGRADRSWTDAQACLTKGNTLRIDANTIATLTVDFLIYDGDWTSMQWKLDSKGNGANNMTTGTAVFQLTGGISAMTTLGVRTYDLSVQFETLNLHAEWD